ncbi:hypothetical protein OGAPHI_002859 [Ogataea philodendri]|uniref:Uncharacterized protein n=1 Tax=Ogataea philodendri TaxID=1378263 RepID=A0A9P8P8Z8_9ASCO|nr:uncharacterized protein OGAPHI_002859 [Ogataea philodendri]KAH3667210.1 hypothetical protein OGAPHI_002859 [Ogataea philodendri]
MFENVRFNNLKSERWTHGGLDDEGTNVLPVLLEQRNQEVDSHHDLGDKSILLHLNVANSDSQTQNLLKLELNGGLHIGNLGVQVVVVRDWSWELTSLGQLRTQKSWNLLNQNLRSNESIVLLGQLLDELLVLVQLLQVINRHGIDTKRLSSVDIESITKNTDGHVRSWNLRKLQGTRETLVSLWVVVLKTNLQFNGLQEVSLLGLVRELQDLLDVVSHLGGADFGHSL